MKNWKLKTLKNSKLKNLPVTAQPFGLPFSSQGHVNNRLFGCQVWWYCQEWEIDQLLQFCRCNFIFWIFGLCLKQNIRPKYAPSRRTNYTLKWRGGEAAPPIYFIFIPSRRGIFLSNIFIKKPSKNQKNEIAPAEL